MDVLKLNVASDGVWFETLFGKTVDGRFLKKHRVDELVEMIEKKGLVRQADVYHHIKKTIAGRLLALCRIPHQHGVYLHSSLCFKPFFLIVERHASVFYPVLF